MTGGSRLDRRMMGTLGIVCVGTLILSGCASKQETGGAQSSTQGATAPVKPEVSIARIQSDPHIPEAQKAMLIRQIQGQQSAKAPAKP